MLKSREWVSVFVVLALMLSLLAVRLIKDLALDVKYVKLEAEAKNSQIAIYVTGAVQESEVYYVRPGVTVKSILEKAKLLNTADRKRIPFKKVLYHSQELAIPSKNKKKEGI